jgi:adenylosuccinate synthase
MFLHEVKRTGTEGRVWVDRKCSIIEEEHIRKDRKAKYLAERLSTTGQGVGPAVESRVKRTAAVAEEIPELEPYLADVALEVNKAIDEGLKVVVEGTQGFYLSLYHGTYPYVTSRDTSASGVCSEAGVPPTKVDEVLLVLKSFVTRVGHGPLPNELSEEEAVRRRWVEVATVTRRKRRAAPFNYELAKNAALVSGATQIALTKLDVLFPECKGTKSFDDLPREAKKFVMEVETKIGTPVTLIGTGPETDEMVDRRI